jgi:hypothetical protein
MLSATDIRLFLLLRKGSFIMLRASFDMYESYCKQRKVFKDIDAYKSNQEILIQLMLQDFEAVVRENLMFFDVEHDGCLMVKSPYNNREEHKKFLEKVSKSIRKED